MLPEIPAATGPPLSLADALTLSGQILHELVASDPPADLDEDGGTAPSTRSPGSGAARAGQNRLQRRGDHWEIEYTGEAFTARHSKGIGDLARLMAQPDTEIPAADLIGAAVVSSDTGEVLDASARRQYEQRIRDLQADLVEAEDNKDLGRVEQVTAELDALVEQLSSAVGLGGRSRRSGGSNERARTAVTRRIRTAISHLDRLCPALGRHLEASVRTGTYCAYRPEAHTKWRIDD